MPKPKSATRRAELNRARCIRYQERLHEANHARQGAQHAAEGYDRNNPPRSHIGQRLPQGNSIITNTTNPLQPQGAVQNTWYNPHNHVVHNIHPIGTQISHRPPQQGHQPLQFQQWPDIGHTTMPRQRYCLPPHQATNMANRPHYMAPYYRNRLGTGLQHEHVYWRPPHRYPIAPTMATPRVHQPTAPYHRYQPQLNTYITPRTGLQSWPVVRYPVQAMENRPDTISQPRASTHHDAGSHRNAHDTDLNVRGVCSTIRTDNDQLGQQSNLTCGQKQTTKSRPVRQLFVTQGNHTEVTSQHDDINTPLAKVFEKDEDTTPEPAPSSNQTDAHSRIGIQRNERHKLQQSALANYFTNQHNNLVREDSKAKTTHNQNISDKTHDQQPTNQDELSDVIQNIRMDLASRPLQTLAEIANPSTITRLKRKQTFNLPCEKRHKIATIETREGELSSPPHTPLKRLRIPTTPLTPKRKEEQRLYMKKRRLEIRYRDMERAARRCRPVKRYLPKPKLCPMKKLISRFREIITEGPSRVCMPCNRMMYKHTVRPIKKVKTLGTEAAVLCTTVIGDQVESDWICFCCHRHIMNGRVPPMSIANGLAFPKKPVKMDLHQLEWRLLAPRIVFMKIHQAPMGKQFKLKGSVVNVVANVANTVNSLPRTQGNMSTIPVKLKRRLKFKHHTISQNIRPNTVRKAAKWLVNNGPLYKEAKIEYNDICFMGPQPENNMRLSTTNEDVESGVYKTNHILENPRERYRCLLKINNETEDGSENEQPVTCTYISKTYREAITHIQSNHNAHDRDSDRGHTHNSSAVYICAQERTSSMAHYNYYCPECAVDFADATSPAQHMYNEHGLIDLDNALSYHNCVGGEFTLHTYKLYEPQQVALTHHCENTSYMNKTWVIEKVTLQISQSYIEKRQPLGRPSRKWSIKYLPENRAYQRIFETIISPGSGAGEPQNGKPSVNNTDSDSDNEVEATGTTDTMLTEQDYLEPPEFQAIYNFAPAENSTPKSIFLDKYCEEMAYPDIYLGHARQAARHVPVHYAEIVKSELLQVDRRAALNVENIFFKVIKLQMKFLTSRTNLALRQHKTSDMNITAGSLRNPETVRNIIQHDQGYQFLATLRGSPPYFKRAKQDLFAMIRQLGPATFFISLSSAETKWKHLLKILGRTVDKVEYSDLDIDNMTWENRCRLIQSDPVTCARHFDYQLHIVMAKFFKSQQTPIGKILDFFYRIEMQHRGSCHVHMVVWILGAPTLEKDDISVIIRFIDKYITCQAPIAEGTTEDELVSRQKHHHSHTCKKESNSVCRFRYPQPPFPETVILDPLEDTDPDLGECRTKWGQIYTKLEGMTHGTTLTFDKFLEEIECTYDEYRRCVQTSIKARSIFLRRTPQEITINNYNRNTLLAWQANMDIQYVLDAYACATYIAAYISKSSRGMSKLLRQASAEVRAGNHSIKESMRHIGNQFVNSVEISAQEAAYLALQLSLRKSSRATVFISTSPPNERVRLLKKQTDLEAMDEEDTNVDSSNLVKRYSKRPKKLERISLAEWAAWYDTSGRKKPEQDPDEDIDGTPIQDLRPLYEENEEDFPIGSATNDMTSQKRRKKARVIRCPWFDVKVHEDHHYRELIMLFTPWRDEEVDILGGFDSHKEHYMERKGEIAVLLEEYSPGRTAVEEAQIRLAQENEERQREAVVAPSAQHNNEDDQAKEDTENDPTFRPHYDIGQDIGTQVLPGVTMTEYQQNRITENQLGDIIRQLNTEQRTFFTYISNVVRAGQNQIFAFLSGGAGVGKSHLSKAIYQYLLKEYTTGVGEDPDSLSVLVMAPTGKSAHLIKGLTIHSALRMPFSNLGAEYRPLTVSNLNTLRSELGQLKFVIIDEISMVGTNLFNYVDGRLQDIKGLRVPFGGVHMLCIGDLYQLQPVFDKWIFLSPSEGTRALKPNSWVENFKLYELKKIMRQREHQPFAEMLNRLREGKQTESDTDYIRSKCVNDRYTDPKYPHRAITHLFSTNKAVDEYNIAARSQQPIKIIADDHINGTSNAELTRVHLAAMKEKKAKDAQGLASVLVIAIADRVEVSVNIGVREGLTNGAAGLVKKLPSTQDNTDSVVATGVIWVLFDDMEVGCETRKRRKCLQTPDVHADWTPIETLMKRIQISRNTEITATRTQFPIRVAAAKTIHRSQGQTLHSVVADFKSSFGHHMHYVALSRVTNPENLYITYFDKNAIATDTRVHTEMNRLRTMELIDIPRHLDYRIMGANTVACFINIRSLNRHADDLAADYNYKYSFFTALAETHLMPTTSLQTLENTHRYTDHNRYNYTETTTGAKHGISCFATAPLAHVTHRNTQNMECTVARVTYPDTITFIVVYRYHRTAMRDFMDDLQKILEENTEGKLVVIGDMNLNTQVPAVAHRIRTAVLEPNNLRQLKTGPTTKMGSTIDHVYTNIEDARAIVVPTYYSDHDLIKVSTM